MARKLSEMQMRCIEEFKEAASSAENDAELGQAFRELYLQLGRLQRGIEFDDARRDAVDAETLDRLQDLTELDAEFSVFEGFSRRLVANPQAAMRYLADHNAAQSSKQSKRARKPRPSRRDGITLLIEELLEDDPMLTSKRVGELLANMTGEITFLDGVFRHNRTADTLEEGNLPSRVSDAKKRLKANSD